MKGVLNDLSLELECAYNLLDNSDDADLIDGAIFQINSIEKKIASIVKKEKQDVAQRDNEN